MHGERLWQKRRQDETLTRAAATRPLIEYRPNCCNPGKPEGSNEANPHTDVSMPKRTVGHQRRCQELCPAPLSRACRD